MSNVQKDIGPTREESSNSSRLFKTESLAFNPAGGSVHMQVDSQALRDSEKERRAEHHEYIDAKETRTVKQ